MKALVTGASGFVGSQLVRSLVASGSNVVCVVRPGADLRRLQPVLGDVEILERDLLELDAADGEPALRGVTVVHHLGAAGVDPRATDVRGVVETNVLGTQAVVELALRLGVERFVYCGSCFEYGVGSRLREDAPLQPRNAYAASKSAGWLLARAALAAESLPLVTLRPFTVYGPYEAAHRLVPSCGVAAIAGLPVRITSGEQRRDFVHVEDVAAAFALAATAPGAVGGTFNVCTGVETPVREVAEGIVRLARTDSAVEAGALPHRHDERAALSGDPGRASSELGFRARISLETGLAQTLDWLRSHQDAYASPAEAR